MAKKGGESEREENLVEMGIRQMPARISRPQTGGEPGRFRGGLKRKMRRFKDVAGQPGMPAQFGSEP